ncbi:SusC/RagA family TonB-linked outer membrane protein [Flavobacterium piscisymbiosum]|uniref:SusC/RagA family TonB-linked outer membrane protein n=1 Tax=Flavobacterium piscisymbiosum TaxID=2893753 RepID=A0ABS8M8M3_9FLAO|nr:SusC/RagA family TonB-linked outer membrane protein [Flavobacterium sp. F-30]MCC9061814.1 SusC/RagA family TonB-linked outer membrane protein [Flavobacterium sp. F-30]
MKLKFNGFLVLLLVLIAQLTFAQERAVSGTVSDNTGMPLPGVSVLVKGTKTATQTDFDGKYSIKAAPNQVLIFSYIGMQSQELAASSSNVNAKLKNDSVELESVVVTALGIKKEKKALGYATQEVKAAELTRGNNNSLAGALQGKLAGVQITPSSGAPGASSQIVIRGARSFTGNNTPLYIIDGMPVASQADYSTGNSVTGSDLANRAVDIDPNDIESINILKGQAASVIYGLRASNGVVVITTKSGKGASKSGKPTINFNSSITADDISRKINYQDEYAQGTNGVYGPTNSLSWGPKISSLPNDPAYGGNVPNTLNGMNAGAHPGKYYVPQRASAGLDPWVAPKVYDNFGDFFKTGITVNNSFNLTQATEKSNYAFSLGSSNQDGFIPETGMDRYNAKAAFSTKLGDEWKTGFVGNYVNTKISKATGANDSSVAGAFASPISYDLKGNGFATPTDPYKQIYYRPTGFNNPYWAAKNNIFDEQTDRFYGNTYVEFTPVISANDQHKITFRYQLGADTYTTNYRDIQEYGNSQTTAGHLDLYGISSRTINSLFTVNYEYKISDDLNLTALLGNEINDRYNKSYEMIGNDLNFGGFPNLKNARQTVATDEIRQNRTFGVFGNVNLSYKNFIFLAGTVRNDIVSSMPRDNRSFTYPSVSLGLVLTELEALKGNSTLSFAKLRGSWAEVGQAGDYYDNYYTVPSYSGGFWLNAPVNYPLGGTNSYIPNNVMYDPNLKPQNTRSYELGGEFRFFKDRISVDYTYSRQDVIDQIFSVPLAGSTGAANFVTNGGKIHTNSHELTLSVVPVRTNDFEWTISANYTQIDNFVDELKEGVPSITLGGFTTPQIRAGIGERFPVIYGTAFARDANGNILVNANGLPISGVTKSLGEVSPKFNLGGTTAFRYKKITLAATFDWKNGGKMYSGTNSLLDTYGLSAKTGNRDELVVQEGVLANGQPNTKGVTKQALYDAYSNIHETAVYDASFVKLREISLGYTLPQFSAGYNIRVNAFARNILLWAKMPNLDPESSQGNNNMAGGFERLSVPQTTSIGVGMNLTIN